MEYKESLYHNHEHTNLFTFLLCFVLVLSAGRTSVSAETDGEKLGKTLLIEKYLEFAFGDATRITKFSSVPKIGAICNTPSCKTTLTYTEELFGISGELISYERFPAKVRDADITIVFADSISEPLKMSFARSGDGQLEMWGGPACRVMRLRRDYTVLGAVIYVGRSSLRNANKSCLLVEIARASGGNFREQYEAYSTQLAKYSDYGYQTFAVGMGYFTKVHWSPALHPGDDRGSVSGQLDDLID